MSIVQMENITKVYGNGVYANQGVNFNLQQGEIHALVGENGAGKSTLMKILFGLEKPTNGKILFNGKEVQFTSPQDAMKIGIGMVHQHFMLVDSFSVTENVVLGFEPTKKLYIDKETSIQKVNEISQSFDLKINPNALVRDLQVGIKQKVEILKTLYRGAKIIILDEPTAVLTPQETIELFSQLKKLKEKGFTIIFISHKLKEVKEISDRITVMRKGKMITTIPTREVNEQEISELMVGENFSNKIEKQKPSYGDVFLQAEHIFWTDQNKVPILQDISFSVRSGEILGIAGVEGNGQNELIEIITGLKKGDKGKIQMFAEETTNEAISSLRFRGMAYIPSDRISLGTAGKMTIEDNIISTKLGNSKICKTGLLNTKNIKNISKHLIEEFTIKCGSEKTEVGMLSGGNMQKVVVAREFTQNAKLIIAEQPTRGIDVGAAKFIHKKLVQLRDEGCAVLLVSADLEELTKLSDSIIVMYEGKLSAYIEDVQKTSDTELGYYMLGAKMQNEEEIRRAYHA